MNRSAIRRRSFYSCPPRRRTSPTLAADQTRRRTKMPATENIGRRHCIPVVHVRGTHYEVGFDVVISTNFSIFSFFSGVYIVFLDVWDVSVEWDGFVSDERREIVWKIMDCVERFELFTLTNRCENGLNWYSIFRLEIDCFLCSVSMFSLNNILNYIYECYVARIIALIELLHWYCARIIVLLVISLGVVIIFFLIYKQ